VQQVSYGPLIMSIMIIVSCYRLGSLTCEEGGNLSVLFTSHPKDGLVVNLCFPHTTDGHPFKPKKLSVPFLYPRVPAGLAPFRGLVPLGRRNLVPILPLWEWGGGNTHE
jgi:hypothetical protein